MFILFEKLNDTLVFKHRQSSFGDIFTTEDDILPAAKSRYSVSTACKEYRKPRVWPV